MDNARLAQTLLEIHPTVLQALWKIIPFELEPNDLQTWYLLLRYMYRRPLSDSDLRTLSAYTTSPNTTCMANGKFHPPPGPSEGAHQFLSPSMPASHNDRTNFPPCPGPTLYTPETLSGFHMLAPLEPGRKRSADALCTDNKRQCYESPYHPTLPTPQGQQTSGPFVTSQPATSHSGYAWATEPIYSQQGSADGQQF